MNAVVPWSKQWLRAESKLAMPKRDESTLSETMQRMRESAADAKIHLMGMRGNVHVADLPAYDPSTGPRNRAERRRAHRAKRRANSRKEQTR